jgi:hypothetical protein
MNLKKSELSALIKKNKLNCMIDEKWCDGWTVTGWSEDYDVLRKEGLEVTGIGVGLNYNCTRNKMPAYCMYVHWPEEKQNESKESSKGPKLRRRMRAD